MLGPCYPAALNDQRLLWRIPFAAFQGNYCLDLLCVPVQVLRQADRVCRGQSLAPASTLLSMLCL